MGWLIRGGEAQLRVSLCLLAAHGVVVALLLLGLLC
jgi:hypothetical protein